MHNRYDLADTYTVHTRPREHQLMCMVQLEMQQGDSFLSFLLTPPFPAPRGREGRLFGLNRLLRASRLWPALL